MKTKFKASLQQIFTKKLRIVYKTKMVKYVQSNTTFN